MKSQEARKREGRTIAVCWGGIAAVSLLLWPILDSSSATFILECLQALTLAITGVIVWYYTRETKRLREEAQRQTAQLLRPFVFITAAWSPEALAGVQLGNIGNSAAINVTVEIEAHRLIIPVLHAGQSRKIDLMHAIGEAGPGSVDDDNVLLDT
jgi:hypothetical protein